MKPPRILLADDHALVRAGFSSLLDKLGAQVVGEASDGHETLRLLPLLEPDIVLLDIAMPGLNGLEAAGRIAQEFPATRVIILSMHATAEYARRAVQAGAAGYLLKDASAAELELALQAVARGEIFLSPRIATFIVADYAHDAPAATQLDKLSSRQREILQLIAEGHTRKEIAATLSISVKTFDTYRAQLMAQLDIHDVPGLVLFAAESGLIPRNE